MSLRGCLAATCKRLSFTQEGIEAKEQGQRKDSPGEGDRERKTGERVVEGGHGERKPAAHVLRTRTNWTHSPVQLCRANALFFSVFLANLHPELLIQLVLGGAQVSVLLFKVFQGFNCSGKPGLGTYRGFDS